MVEIVESWKILKDHVDAWRSSMVMFRMESQGDKTRLRIRAGNLGLDRTYSPKDPELDEILSFLDEHRAMAVVKQLPSDVFFM
jgi:hypothetical protein